MSLNSRHIAIISTEASEKMTIVTASSPGKDQKQSACGSGGELIDKVKFRVAKRTLVNPQSMEK